MVIIVCLVIIEYLQLSDTDTERHLNLGNIQYTGEVNMMIIRRIIARG